MPKTNTRVIIELDTGDTIGVDVKTSARRLQSKLITRFGTLPNICSVKCSSGEDVPDQLRQFVPTGTHPMNVVTLRNGDVFSGCELLRFPSRARPLASLHIVNKTVVDTSSKERCNWLRRGYKGEPQGKPKGTSKKMYRSSKRTRDRYAHYFD